MIRSEYFASDRVWTKAARRPLRLTALAGLVFGLLAWSTVASAAPGWVAITQPPASPLSEMQPTVDAPQVAMDARGTTYAAWLNYNDTVEPPGYVLQAALRPAGSSWREPVALQTGYIDSETLQVSASSNGHVVVAWELNNGTFAAPQEWVAQTATRTPEGDPGDARDGWSAPQSLPDSGSFQFEDRLLPQLAVDSHGNAVAVWQHWSSETTVQPMRSYLPAGGSWQQATALSSTPSETLPAPAVATAGGGETIAAWVNPNRQIVAQQTSGGAGGTWGYTTPFSVVGDGNKDLRLAGGGDGTIAAVWIHDLAGPAGAIAHGLTLPPGSSLPASPVRDDAELGAPCTPSVDDACEHMVGTASGNGPRFPQVSVDAQGNAFAVWEAQMDGLNKARASAWSAAAGSWIAPANLSDSSDDAYEPRIAASAGGALATWLSGPSGSGRPQAAGLELNPGPTPYMSVPFVDFLGTDDRDYGDDPARRPRVAADDDGNAVVAWANYFDGGATEVSSDYAAYDAAGPRLDDMSIPAQATVGEAASFSVTPVDVWSEVTNIAWDFGDGATATDAATSHAYSAAGTYTVRVTATDDLGNETASTGTLTVQAPPGEPQPGPAEPGASVPAPPTAESRPSLQIIVAKAAVTRTGATRLTLSCQAGATRPCAGKLTLRTAAKIKQGKRKRVVTLGSASYSIAAGKTAAIRVRLSKAGQRLVRRLGKVKVKITATVRDAAATSTATRTIILRAAR